MAEPTKIKSLAVRDNTAVVALQRALESIPSPEDDPTERMLVYIAEAPPEEWETLWSKLPNLKDNVGRRLRVDAIRAAPSDFDGRLSHYLICEGVWEETGERTLVSCSSEMCVAQLIRLYADGRLPARLEIVQKEKPTKAGFRPIHFRYLANQEQPAAEAVIPGSAEVIG